VRENLRSAVVKVLSRRYKSFDLGGAFTTRLAAELADRHDGAIPTAEIDAAVACFTVRLRAACNAIHTLDAYDHGDEAA
jgi:hypothetical protein